MQILSGIKVIDVTQFISGSRCTQLLADMGAELVKVEPSQGDTLGMNFQLMPGAERCYSVFNRNKYGTFNLVPSYLLTEKAFTVNKYA